MAQAKSAEGFALERLGRLDDAMSALAQAQELFTAAGDRLGAAVALQMSGTVLLDKADYPGARRTYDAALVVFRQLGAQQRIAATLNNIGNVLYDQVQLEEAKQHYEEVLRIDREIGDRRGAAGALGNLANVLDTMGDLAGARTMQEQGLAAFREVGDRRGTASTLNNLGNVLMELGDLAAARARYEESLSITRETGTSAARRIRSSGLPRRSPRRDNSTRRARPRKKGWRCAPSCATRTTPPGAACSSHRLQSSSGVRAMPSGWHATRWLPSSG